MIIKIIDIKFNLIKVNMLLYSNPIERYFNQLKHYIKKDEPMSYDLIKTSIKNPINKISKESYINYFKSSLEKNKKDIELSTSRYIKKPKIYKT